MSSLREPRGDFPVVLVAAVLATVSDRQKLVEI